MLKEIEQLQEAYKQNKEANEKLQKTIEKLQGADKQSKDTNEKLQKEMQKLTKNPVPLGFIYVQLPKEKGPQEIWSSAELKWTDISSTFDSTFFRVAGSKAAAFGAVQEDFSPFIDEVTYENCELTKFFGEKQCDDSFPYARSSKLDRRSPSSWSGRVVTANRYYSSLNGWLPKDTSISEWTGTVKFHSVGGEVRPRNMAVKVWKRTGWEWKHFFVLMIHYSKFESEHYYYTLLILCAISVERCNNKKLLRLFVCVCVWKVFLKT